MMRMMRRLAALRADSRGATAIEYGLVVALIALSCVTAFQAMGDSVHGMWGNISAAAQKNM